MAAKNNVAVTTNTVGALRLVDEPRIDVFRETSPDGYTVEITNNVDTGERTYLWLDGPEATGTPQPEKLAE